MEVELALRANELRALGRPDSDLTFGRGSTYILYPSQAKEIKPKEYALQMDPRGEAHLSTSIKSALATPATTRRLLARFIWSFGEYQLIQNRRRIYTRKFQHASYDNTQTATWYHSMLSNSRERHHDRQLYPPNILLQPIKLQLHNWMVSFDAFATPDDVGKDKIL